MAWHSFMVLPRGIDSSTLTFTLSDFMKMKEQISIHSSRPFVQFLSILFHFRVHGLPLKPDLQVFGIDKWKLVLPRREGAKAKR